MRSATCPSGLPPHSFILFTSSSLNSSQRLSAVTKFSYFQKAFDINKEFIVYKSYKPTNYTTEVYNKNDHKNRYDDILCMDATRVVLKDRAPEDNYIHANWIMMPDKQPYICTQGPLAATLEDFWHMIYTEKSNVIVMLTALEDGMFIWVSKRWLDFRRSDVQVHPLLPSGPVAADGRRLL